MLRAEKVGLISNPLLTGALAAQTTGQGLRATGAVTRR